jgi:hypothetical protein
MTTDHGRIPPQEPVIENFRDIKEYYIGEERYTMTYTPFPEKKYDGIMDWGEGNIFVLLTNGEKKELSKEEYISIMDDFGDVAGFQPLEREIIHERMW